MRVIKLSASLLFCLGFSLCTATAFSLLGPYAPWMGEYNSFRDGTIGGPLTPGEEYRWNVPVVTYAFDQSFLNYFGSNGVAAVESAIQILNDLPPASSLNPSNYPFTTLRANFVAQNLALIDLKSTALSCLLEQMGLASPERSIFCVQNFSVANGATNCIVVTRNIDPITELFSSNVNNVQYSYFLTHAVNSFRVDAAEFPLDIYAESFTSVAGFNSRNIGQFFSGLTFDDVGGLKFLLKTNNVQFESLLPDVKGTGTNASNYVNRALRPGRDKITFQRVNYNPLFQEVFPPFTYFFTDTFLSNSVFKQQSLERVVTKPDILFTSEAIGFDYISRTGTTNWQNNGSIGQNGPGVIQPPVRINFNRVGPSLQNDGTYPVIYTSQQSAWGTFDNTTNSPITYPINAGVNNTTVLLMRLLNLQSKPVSEKNYSWILTGQTGGRFLLQTSTNLVEWSTITTVTNQGATFTYIDVTSTNAPQRYFRTVSE